MERASERMRAADCAGEASSVKQAVQGNEQVDKQMTQNPMRGFHSISTHCGTHVINVRERQRHRQNVAE